MHIFCDESGNTGLDLLSTEQPLFSLASTNLDADICQQLIAPLLRQGQAEAKYSKLKGTARGQAALLNLFSSAELTVQAVKFYMADKRYYVITHLVDKLIEPPLHEAGIDLYENDAHVGLVNLWYYAGDYLLPNGHWERLLRAFVAAMRQRTPAAYADFDRTLTAAAVASSPKDRDFVAGIVLARGRLEEFIGVYDDNDVFDPAADVFIDVINKWMSQVSGSFAVTHDRSKPMARSEGRLRAMMTPITPRTIGYGAREAELPLRISSLNFGDSAVHPQLQLADLVAGAAVDCFLAWSGKRPQSEYHDAMRRTNLSELFIGGMLPDGKVVRDNPRRPGQSSLVDGAVDFFREVGYAPRKTSNGQ